MSEKDIEREEKLNALQTKHRQLLLEKKPLQADYKKKTKILDAARRALDEKNKEIRDVGQQIFSMKHSGQTPHVTDHAVVRYLERVEGVDIWALRDKVAGDKNAVREGNVVVTVNEDLDEA